LILVDTNVVVAALWAGHPHHAASIPIVGNGAVDTIMIAVHSVSETYATMTRMNRPFRLSGTAAMAAIAALTATIRVVSLDGAQTLDTIRRFSAIGYGPRLYDFLIGATGEAHGADTIVTWNTRDFDGLFPAMRIVTPSGLADLRPQRP
jgi:predicted nucleic acid-binding protein